MYSRRSPRLSEASKKSPQRSPTPDKEVIRRKLRGKRRSSGLRKSKANNCMVNTDERRGHDIIDIINSSHEAKHVAEGDEGQFVEVADEGVDQSDEDCHSVTSSIVSGPSHARNDSPKKLRPSEGLCSACRKLYQKAKKMKTPIKNKLLDNDPKSMTCDQWVLIKDWRPRRLPNARGNLLTHLQLVKKRLKVKRSAKQTAQCVGEGGPSICLRPHTFLQRNLRQFVPVKKERRKNRRKRTRENSQGPRRAKQQRLHSSSHSSHISIDCTVNDRLQPTNDHSSSPPLKKRREQEIDNSADTHLTVECLPSSVTLETKQREIPSKQRAAKKTSGFRELLTRMRGNSSMIVKETRWRDDSQLSF